MEVKEDESKIKINLLLMTFSINGQKIWFKMVKDQKVILTPKFRFKMSKKMNIKVKPLRNLHKPIKLKYSSLSNQMKKVNPNQQMK